jgi:hypothetical protein
MNLPQRYQDQILTELEKPKSKQKFTEDLFIELERALTTVERAMPSTIPDRDVVRRVLLKKFKNEVIDNRVLFRLIAKIARAAKVGADVDAAEKQLIKLFQDNNYTIEEAFANSVSEAYAERDIGTRISTLLGLLDDLEGIEIEEGVRAELKRLLEKVSDLLGEGP